MWNSEASLQPGRSGVRNEGGFTLLEIAVALAILALAIGQLFVLFPTGVRLQQKAEHMTNVTELGKYMLSEVRGGARVSTHYEKGFLDVDTGNQRGFLQLAPTEPDDDERRRPWDVEVFNGRDDNDPTDGVIDEDAGGRIGDGSTETLTQPWAPLDAGLDFNTDEGEGWIGSPSPLLVAKVLDEYRSKLDDPTTVVNMDDLVAQLSPDSVPTLFEKVMEYRWTATVVKDMDGENPLIPLYGLDSNSSSRMRLKAQNENLCFQIFGPKPGSESDEDASAKTLLKKISVKVYWRDGDQYNRSEEFVTYVANY